MLLGTTLIGGTAGLYFAHLLRAPLNAVLAALRQIRQGRFDEVRLSTSAGGELGELQQALVQTAERLEIARRELEDRVAQRTADAERRRLLARTNQLLEEERQRIAVEIHDDLNAALIVAKLKAEHIASLAASPESEQSVLPEIERTARTISATTEVLYAAARNIVKRLRPEVIDTLGLRGAAQELVRHYDELTPGCRFQLRIGSEFPDLRGGALAITCYRLVQEALSNVAKHAHAGTADVHLSAEAGTISITVHDDGAGFDPKQAQYQKLGLVGMRERVESAGGDLAIRSAPGAGTRVSIRLPLDRVEPSPVQEVVGS